MAKRQLKVLEILNKSKLKEDLEESEDEEILAVKIPKQVIKQKKPKTPAQMAALEKGRAIAMANFAERKKASELRAKEEQKIYEARVVKKAVAIKKKEIKKLAELDEISDDDTPIEEIKQIIKTKKPASKVALTPPPPPAPKYRFI